MTDTTNLVTPKAADAPETFKGDAARPAPPWLISTQTAKVTDWNRNNDGPMDYTGELFANWWLRSSLYDWFMERFLHLR